MSKTTALPPHWVPVNARHDAWIRLDGWVLEPGLEPASVQQGPNVTEQSVHARVGFLFRPLTELGPYLQRAGMDVPVSVRPPPAESWGGGTALARRESGALIPTSERNPEAFKGAVLAPGQAFFARPDPLASVPLGFLSAATPIAAMRYADRHMPPPAWMALPPGWLDGEEAPHDA